MIKDLNKKTINFKYQTPGKKTKYKHICFYYYKEMP